MKLHTYAGLSFVGTLIVIYHAFSSKGQFYPAMVYLSTSKVNLVLLLNMGLVIMCIMWQLVKRIFLGSLREVEVERLNEQSWREVMEILFAITIFRQDFSVAFLSAVTALLMIKSLHWLAQKRVEYIETTPSIPMLSHIRIVSFLVFLLVLDSLFFYNSLKYLLKTWKASVSLFFAFEYIILATTTVSTFLKYIFYVSDMILEGQWEKKAVYTFYLELVRDLLHLTMYLLFFFVIFLSYGVPLHLIRELYETFHSFKVRVADYIRYRKITSNMNDRFPDATPEEINSIDATCIICREEMVTAKKLTCGHFFHVHCLRSWLERQNTCPICRALVVPPETPETSSAGQPAAQTTTQQSALPDETNGGGLVADDICQHQARVQAAAAAAAVYSKSCVYPYPNTVTWSHGYAFLPQMPAPVGENSDATNIKSSGQSSSATAVSQAFHQHVSPNEYHSVSLHQLPFGSVIPFQIPNLDPGSSQRLSDSELSLEARETSIKNQIEVLTNQLRLLHQQYNHESTLEVVEENTLDKDTKNASSTLISDCGCHDDTEDNDRDSD